MKLNNLFELIDLGLYSIKDNALIVSDFHLGFEEAMNSQGIFIPRFNFKEIKKRFEKIFKQKKKFDLIIIAGDLKHDFAGISLQENKEILELISLMETNSKKVILIRGNHDNFLITLAKRKKIELEKKGFFLKKSNSYVMHGDKLIENEFFKKAKTIIVGHEHPAIDLSDGLKSEKFKCFLKGKFNKKELIVLPSMNSVFIGTNVKKEKLLSPFLKKNKSEFEVYAFEDKHYFMGKIKIN